MTTKDFKMTVRRRWQGGGVDEMQFDVTHTCRSSQCNCATMSMDKITGMLSDLEFQANAANEPLASTRGVVRVAIDTQ